MPTILREEGSMFLRCVFSDPLVARRTWMCPWYHQTLINNATIIACASSLLLFVYLDRLAHVNHVMTKLGLLVISILNSISVTIINCATKMADLLMLINF